MESTKAHLLEEGPQGTLMHTHTHTLTHTHTYLQHLSCIFRYISPGWMKKHLLPCLMRVVKRDTRKHRGVHRTVVRH